MHNKGKHNYLGKIMFCIWEHCFVTVFISSLEPNALLLRAFLNTRKSWKFLEPGWSFRVDGQMFPTKGGNNTRSLLWLTFEYPLSPMSIYTIQNSQFILCSQLQKRSPRLCLPSELSAGTVLKPSVVSLSYATKWCMDRSPKSCFPKCITISLEKGKSYF